MDCANHCGEQIRKTRPGDHLADEFEYVHESGNPVCDGLLVATPPGPPRLAHIVIGCGGDGSGSLLDRAGLTIEGVYSGYEPAWRASSIGDQELYSFTVATALEEETREVPWQEIPGVPPDGYGPAEAWCRLEGGGPSGCVNGPAAHRAHATCQRRDEAATGGPVLLVEVVHQESWQDPRWDDIPAREGWQVQCSVHGLLEDGFAYAKQGSARAMATRHRNNHHRGGGRNVPAGRG